EGVELGAAEAAADQHLARRDGRGGEEGLAGQDDGPAALAFLARERLRGVRRRDLLRAGRLQPGGDPLPGEAAEDGDRDQAGDEAGPETDRRVGREPAHELLPGRTDGPTWNGVIVP